MLAKRLALLRGAGALCAVVFFCATEAVSALDSSGVMVLYNANSPQGAQIASYYRQVHGPDVLIVGLENVPSGEDISANVYIDQILPQVRSALDSAPTIIECIVTTKGLPLRIDNPPTMPFPCWGRWSSWA